MADHTSITDTTPQPIQETPSETIAAPSSDHPPEKPPESVTVAAGPSIEPLRLNREQRREVHISHITETILETFDAHDGRMRALSHKPPKVARRICQIILHGAHSDVAAMVAVDEPYTVIVTCNRIPVKAEEWRAATMAMLTERLGMPVHITLMKEERFLAHCRNVTPFYEALSISHDTLYPYDGDVYPPLGPVAPSETPQEQPEETSEDAPAETPEPEDDGLLTQLLEEPEVQQVREMLVRAQKPGGFPDADTVKIMEQSVRDVFETSLLFSDLITADVPFYRRGLSWLAASLQRDAERLYRFYHGTQPRYD